MTDLQTLIDQMEEACFLNDRDIVNTLIKENEDNLDFINHALTIDGVSYPSLLHWAIQTNAQETLNHLLIIDKIKIDKMDNLGRTPLILAAQQKESLTTLKKLFKKPGILTTFFHKDARGKATYDYIKQSPAVKDILTLLPTSLKTALSNQSIHGWAIQGDDTPNVQNSDKIIDEATVRFYDTYKNDLGKYSLDNIQKELIKTKPEWTQEINILFNRAYSGTTMTFNGKQITLADHIRVMWAACHDTERKIANITSPNAEIISDRKKFVAQSIWDIVHAYDNPNSPACVHGTYNFLTLSLRYTHPLSPTNEPSHSKTTQHSSDYIDDLLKEAYHHFYNSLNETEKAEFQGLTDKYEFEEGNTQDEEYRTRQEQITYDTYLEKSKTFIESYAQKIDPAINHHKKFIDSLPKENLKYYDISTFEQALPKKTILQNHLANKKLNTYLEDVGLYKKFNLQEFKAWVDYVDIDTLMQEYNSKTLLELLDENMDISDDRLQILKIIAEKPGVEFSSSGILLFTMLCKYGEAEPLDKFLNAKININAVNKFGTTALILAAINGHASIVEKLLENGANPNAANQYGDTALIWTAKNGHTSIVEKLLENGANPNSVNQHGDTALTHAEKNGHIKIVKILENDPNLVDKDGNTALMRAAKNGHVNIVEKLLEKGANPNSVNQHGDTALIWAADNGHTSIVEKLLEKGANPNIVNKNGDTALIFSACKRHADVVEKLLENGADPNLGNNWLHTIIGTVVEDKRMKALKCLIEKSQSIPDFKIILDKLLFYSQKEMFQEIVPSILARGININKIVKDYPAEYKQIVKNCKEASKYKKNISFAQNYEKSRPEVLSGNINEILDKLSDQSKIRSYYLNIHSSPRENPVRTAQIKYIAETCTQLKDLKIKPEIKCELLANMARKVKEQIKQEKFNLFQSRLYGLLDAVEEKSMTLKKNEEEKSSQNVNRPK